MAKRVHRPRRPTPGKPNGSKKPEAPKPASRRVSHGSVRPARAPQMQQGMPRLMASTPERLQAMRELFWQNVIREILASLVVLSLRLSAKGGTPSDAAGPAGEDALDGRLGLITTLGQRIPIARIFPVFSASVGRSPQQITLSAILESTVFQVHTPGGEVYTLPIQEVRGFHALTESLMDQLEQSSRAAGDGEERKEPFGFAAFTSLARTRLLPEENEENGSQGSGAD